jgi:hypothetical protein
MHYKLQNLTKMIFVFSMAQFLQIITKTMVSFEHIHNLVACQTGQKGEDKES